MKTNEELEVDFCWHCQQLGISPNFNQGDLDWFKMKLGVLSSSRAIDIVGDAIRKRPGVSKPRLTYMYELMAQICTGQFHEVSAKSLDWGNENEHDVRKAYEFATKKKVFELPFFFANEERRYGASTDGLTETGIVEIKNPWNSTNHIKALLEHEIKPEWRWQMQMLIYVFKRDYCDFASHDPRMKKKSMLIIPYEKDDSMQKILKEEIERFIYEMDLKLNKLDFCFGDQWD